MRHWNKLLALLLAMVMTLGMTVTAFADNDVSSDGGATPISEEDKKDDATPAEGEEDKKDDAAPAEGEEDKKDDAAPAEGEEDKKEDAAPAEGEEDKADDATPAEGEEDKKDDAAPAEGEEDKKDDAAAAMNYTDVTDKNWYYGAVSFVTEKKLMDGMTAGTFGPSENMTRQTLAVALYRLAGSPAVTAENPFTDVADDAAYKDAVVWAYSVGVVNGVTETTFSPESTIQRQAIAAMLARYLGVDTTEEGDLSAFTDAGAIQSYAKAALSWAVKNELIKGNADGTVDPRGNATRAQVATILQRFASMAEGKAPSAGASTPAEGDAAPAEGDAAPAGDDASAADAPSSAAAPAEGDEAPAGDGAAADVDSKADDTDKKDAE